MSIMRRGKTYDFVDSFEDVCPNLNDDLALTLKFYGKVKLTFLAFILEEFVELVEECCATVNNTAKINEYMNIFVFAKETKIIL